MLLCNNRQLAWLTVPKLPVLCIMCVLLCYICGLRLYYAQSHSDDGHVISTAPRSASALTQACPTIVMHSSSNCDYEASWDASYTTSFIYSAQFQREIHDTPLLAQQQQMFTSLRPTLLMEVNTLMAASDDLDRGVRSPWSFYYTEKILTDWLYSHKIILSTTVQAIQPLQTGKMSSLTISEIFTKSNLTTSEVCSQNTNPPCSPTDKRQASLP